MKKLLSVLILCLLIVGLAAGCDKKKEKDTTTTTAATTPAPTTTTTPAPTTTTTSLPMHTVVFEGAEGIEPILVEDGCPLIPPADPVRAGYTFGGWNMDGAPFDFEGMVFSDLVLSAVWIPNEYTVVFYGTDGEALSTLTVGHGEALTAPTLTLTDEQILGGWFTAEGGQGDAFDPAAGATASVSYYPHVVAGITLRFADENGTVLVTEKLTAGQKLAAPTAPDKSAENKVFAAWKDGEGNAYDPAVAYTASATFTASYTKYYVVTFVVAGQTVKQELLGAGTVISAPTAPDKDADGNVFAAWKDTAGKTLTAGATATADVTYTALYAGVFTVTFKDGAGNTVATQTVISGENATLPTASGVYYTFSPADALFCITENKEIVLGTLPVSDFEQTSYAPLSTNADYATYFTTTGFKAHWGAVLFGAGQELTFTAEAAGPVNMYIGGDKFTDSSEFFDLEVLVDGKVVNTLHFDSTVKKNWVTVCYLNDRSTHKVTLRVADAKVPEKNGQYGVCVLITSVQAQTPKAPVTSYTVTFAGDAVSIPEQTVAIGGKATRPTDPTRAGYRFDGWMLNGQIFDFDTVLTGDVTLVAKWTAEVEYTVTFVDKDGNALGTSTVLPGKNASLPANPAGGYWSFAPADALYKINESKTVTLTAVSSQGYEAVSMSTTTGNADYKTLFTTTGLAKGYATILYKEGQTLSYTANMAGAVVLNLRKEKVEAGMSLTVDILIDGVVVNTFILDSSFKSQEYTVAYMPDAGEHTVTVRMTKMEGVAADNPDWGTAAFVTVMKVNQAQ